MKRFRRAIVFAILDLRFMFMRLLNGLYVTLAWIVGQSVCAIIRDEQEASEVIREHSRLRYETYVVTPGAAK